MYNKDFKGFLYRENGDIVLIGGAEEAYANTTEIISKDGFSENSFDLQYSYR